MRTIWKFAVPVTDYFDLTMPAESQILSVQSQRNDPQLWALVYPDAPKQTRHFRLIGTGHPIHDAKDNWNFIGTVQLEGGSLIFHLFETGI
jgi:hypothetical protein